MATELSPASAKMAFYVCRWPDFYAVMNACDRHLYQWIEQIEPALRPSFLSGELGRIATLAYSAQYAQWQACESARMATQPQPKVGLRVQVASRLFGSPATKPVPSSDLSSALDVSFTAGADPAPPAPCTPGSDPATWPRLPFYFVHVASQVGINFYPENTAVALIRQTDILWQGIGPWAGARVFSAQRGDVWADWNLSNFCAQRMTLQSDKVFDHFVRFKLFDTPPVPTALAQRSEPFDSAALQLSTTVQPYDPTGQGGRGWNVFIEFTHIESAQVRVVEFWLDVNLSWSPAGQAGFACQGEVDLKLLGVFDQMGAISGDIDGSWQQRVCVRNFKRVATSVRVRYSGVEIASFESAYGSFVSTPYVPGVTACLAGAIENFVTYTVGITKAAFRIESVQSVAGFGVLLTIRVINGLHFAACIVTPFLSGLSDRSAPEANDAHVRLPQMWVVRNLQAHSQSEPISILVPISLAHPGDWPLLQRHWEMNFGQHSYAAALNHFADGLYDAGVTNNPTGSSGPYPDIDFSSTHALRVSDNPLQYAWLQAAYLETSQKTWITSQGDPALDPNAQVLMVGAHKAPASEVFWVPDPRFAPDTPPTYFDQVPFLGYFAWTAEILINTQADLWESRSGMQVIGLDLASAIARYGRTLTLTVALGHPMWSPYYQRWITAFTEWSGGNTVELQNHLIDTQLHLGAPGTVRNVQVTVLKPPYLTANAASVAWWFASHPVTDDTRYLHALTLIKDGCSADSVDVVLMGRY